MRATESSESTGADATQDNNGTLRTMELEDEDSVGLICPLDDVANHEHIMNQQEYLSENIDAELEDDNDVDIIDTTSGTMAVFLKAVHRQLREEVRGRVAKEHWLLTILKAPGADWWIRAGQARVVCKKLGLMYGEPSYYRDIHVWLPDFRWGTEAMPPCVICKSAEEVSPHDFLTNHFGRRVCALTTNYFIVTQRYICACCARRASNINTAVDASGLTVEETILKPQYTFMGYVPHLGYTCHTATEMCTQPFIRIEVLLIY